MDALSLPLKENFKKEVRVEMRGDVECSVVGVRETNNCSNKPRRVQ